ncbi:hypothetical protein CGCSCA4_v014629 [Colletotrichum siamense]|uniref:Uncharacterized protein n=1 Tax=Colletotrichum siamense TaxID=690259 RepID=A0A9P5BLI3_COLSI|nr:hypothetical protein CGCSCA4_v014629 [Colletotrichum siamense]KAF4842281.1 hypothetical protein CGCSCA2_v014634 [Colletotrichum siamense]
MLGKNDGHRSMGMAGAHGQQEGQRRVRQSVTSYQRLLRYLRYQTICITRAEKRYPASLSRCSPGWAGMEVESGCEWGRGYETVGIVAVDRKGAARRPVLRPVSYKTSQVLNRRWKTLISSCLDKTSEFH